MTTTLSYGALGETFGALSAGDLKPATLAQAMSDLPWVTLGKDAHQQPPHSAESPARQAAKSASSGDLRSPGRGPKA